MENLHKLYPHYELNTHKGYPTKKHLALIKKLKKYGYKNFFGADLSQKLLDLVPKNLYQKLDKVDLNKTINETDNFDLHEALYDSSEGSGQHGMYFRVNGAIVMARGANFIPMDQLEGRQSSEAHKIAVQSAAKANMNMIRVWGGM